MRSIVTIMLLLSAAVAPAGGTGLDDLRRVYDAELRVDDTAGHGLARLDVAPDGTMSLELDASVYDSLSLEGRRTHRRRVVLDGSCISGGDVGSDGYARLMVRRTRARLARLTGVLRCGGRRSRLRLEAPLDAAVAVPSGPYVLELDDAEGPETTTVAFTLALDEHGIGRIADAVERDEHDALVATFDDADVLVAPSGIARLWTPRHAVVGQPSDVPEGLALFGALSPDEGITRNDRRFYVGLPPTVPREGVWRVVSRPGDR